VRGHAKAYATRVEQSGMRANDAEAFQSPHPSQAGGRRDRQVIRQVPQPSTVVLLEEGEQATIGAIESVGFHGGS
jgi:hypothetical protein